MLDFPTISMKECSQRLTGYAVLRLSGAADARRYTAKERLKHENRSGPSGAYPERCALDLCLHADDAGKSHIPVGRDLSKRGDHYEGRRQALIVCGRTR